MTGDRHTHDDNATNLVFLSDSDGKKATLRGRMMPVDAINVGPCLP
jgi:hypothetical protein